MWCRNICIISRVILAFDWFLLMINWRTDITSLTFFLVSLFYNTDRFRVALHLFSNRLTEDVKMQLNISDKFALRSRVSPFCSYHILTSSCCDLLLNRRTVIWDLLEKSYILYCFYVCGWFRKKILSSACQYFILVSRIVVSSIKNEWLTTGQVI